MAHQDGLLKEQCRFDLVLRFELDANTLSIRVCSTFCCNGPCSSHPCIEPLPAKCRNLAPIPRVLLGEMALELARLPLLRKLTTSNKMFFLTCRFLLSVRIAARTCKLFLSKMKSLLELETSEMTTEIRQLLTCSRTANLGKLSCVSLEVSKQCCVALEEPLT